VALLLPSLGQRPLLTGALLPKALSDCGREKLEVKTLSVPLKTAYFEGKDDADWDFGEGSPIPYLTAGLQEGSAALVPDLCNECESMFDLGAVLW